MPDAVLEVVDDLAAEYESLDGIVAGLDDRAWDTATPAAGWAVRDEVFHLGFGEELAALALTDPAAFGARLDEMFAGLDALERQVVDEARRLTSAELLSRWRAARDRTLHALRAHDPSQRVQWVTGKMSPASFATARLMETWAHGQDVVDALGVIRLPTRRLRHIAHLGVQTRAFSYAIRGLATPETDVRVELDAPDGERWTWGSEDAPDRVTGPAVDFCLVVTRRRHPADTHLVAEGPSASEWLAIAQAYAGPPTAGRKAGEFG